MIQPRAERSKTSPAIFHLVTPIWGETTTRHELFEAMPLIGGRKCLFVRVTRHQLALRQDMTVHGGIEFGTARIRFQFQFGIKAEDFEEVTVRARWRTGAAVIAFTKVV